jgi:hypothetical protein
MKPYQKKSFFRASMFIVAVLALAFVTSGAIAQSSDRDKPTQLNSNEIRGQESGKQAVYYYNFIGGPGELSVTVDGKTDYYSCPFDVNLFDTDAKLIGKISMVASSEGKREIKRFQLASREPIVMQLVFSENANIKNLSYMVRLEGAFEGGKAESPATNVSKGVLRIEMLDGSVQQIDLNQVKRATIEP